MSVFSDRVAIVTGAASGMGEAISRQLVAAGATVVATDVNAEGLGALQDACAAGPGRVYTKSLNVTDKAAFEALIADTAEQHGQLDYLFNNAGIAVTGEVVDNTFEDWQRTIDINQMGVIYGTLAAYALMRQQGHGHIVNTASIAGLMPAPMLTAYAMTKHAVIGLSLSLREEAKVYGVKVSAVCPGIVRTNIVGANDMRRLNLSLDDPFEFIRQKARINPISADEAATFILKGVKKNLPEIVFPAHGRFAVAAFHNMRKVWETFTAMGLKEMRAGKR